MQAYCYNNHAAYRDQSGYGCGENGKFSEEAKDDKTLFEIFGVEPENDIERDNPSAPK